MFQRSLTPSASTMPWPSNREAARFTPLTLTLSSVHVCRRLKETRLSWALVACTGLRRYIDPFSHHNNGIERTSAEAIIIRDGARKHRRKGLVACLVLAPNAGQRFRPQLEYISTLDPISAVEIAEVYGDRKQKSMEGSVGSSCPTYSPGFAGKIRALASPVSRVRLLLDLIVSG